MMINLFIFFQKIMKLLSNPSLTKIPCLINSFTHLVSIFLRQINPFWIELSYFIIISLMGYGALKFSMPENSSFSPRNIDMFFTSVSSTTVSSMSTVEMEVFSNIQLIFITILMFAGGEIFTSILQLQLTKFKKKNKFQRKDTNKVEICDQIELGGIFSNRGESRDLSYTSIELLSYIIICYLLVVHIAGSSLIYIYINFIPSAKNVLKKKGLNILTFSIFTTISTFANCGFVPTNENMMVFKKNSGLLLILIPQVLLGNTLYPSCLRFFIWVGEKITKREEFSYLLKNSRNLGYNHLFTSVGSKFLLGTVLGFIFVQFVLFCSLEWSSLAMDGLNNYQRVVGSLFEVVNSRHAGESIVDLSVLTSAILVLFVVMMYLPPYTRFLPIEDDDCHSENEKSKRKNKGNNILEQLLFSQLTYLAIFIILICITEKEKMKEDPLNFNLLSIVVEVVSAYGNVGFSMGYSCERQIKHDANCIDASYGFVGKWSNEGKFILILVMFFGRLKKFSMNGGKSWIIS
ncbi:hypothetical protein M9H77_28108 [Catharanthus roseus]|uniref:Uncharacterized protein n=1 Tax=Catharanthus roseus TaxID=4058 RepID=A0ACC0AGA4_CATRO|nr:hypothetical protein M9H77_28108 [Catharanthus roseus]